jgi:hypothetical protein
LDSLFSSVPLLTVYNKNSCGYVGLLPYPFCIESNVSVIIYNYTDFAFLFLSYPVLISYFPWISGVALLEAPKRLLVVLSE